MTDLASLKNILERADIPYEGSEEKSDGTHTFTITVERGYAGFVTIFQFDKYGKLVDMGAYE